MAVVFQGTDLSATIIRQPGGQMTVDNEGKATARESYVGLYSVLASSGPAIDDAHPDFSGLLVSKKTLERRRSTLGTLFVEYVGPDPVGSLPDPVYELDRTASQEPIDTHWKWDDLVAAAGGYGPNKVVTNEGVFVAFGKDCTGNMRGVSTYNAPMTTWTKSYVTAIKPTAVGNVGKIDSPDGSPPSLSDARNWLNMGIRYTKEGGIYRVQQTWLASGPGGWNTNIYDYA